MNAFAIRPTQLRRSFPTGLAVDDLDLEVPRGEVLALLGHNGAVKTTTVRLLNGVLRPDGGSSSVLGFDPATAGDQLRRQTGVLTETAGLDDRLTARENVEFTARMRAMTRVDAKRRTTSLLAQFGLSERADHPVQGMSTGERKRVALARAMIHDPELLFLDEPTSGLDPAATKAVIELVQTLARERGRTIVLCTHFLAEAGQVADRIAVLHRGRLRASGRPSDLARELFPGLAVALDLGRPATDTELMSLCALRNVHEARATAKGATVRVDGRDDVPQLVNHLVGQHWTIFGATPQTVTLEDVYFAIEARVLSGADESTDHRIVTTATTIGELDGRAA
ncbi:MAG: ABC transporter ATP-binding protein [Actinobacteria bacterium]|nr:MAG: ABC transporter ATP-binding protein [Actinomycetota bacterium]